MKPGKAILRALRDVVGRQVVAGGGAGVAVLADEPLFKIAAALVLVANIGADLVLELRKQRELVKVAGAPSVAE